MGLVAKARVLLSSTKACKSNTKSTKFWSHLSTGNAPHAVHLHAHCFRTPLERMTG